MLRTYYTALGYKRITGRTEELALGVGFEGRVSFVL